LYISGVPGTGKTATVHTAGDDIAVEMMIWTMMVVELVLFLLLVLLVTMIMVVAVVFIIFLQSAN
jgi:hypothetical protein